MYAPLYVQTAAYILHIAPSQLPRERTAKVKYNQRRTSNARAVHADCAGIMALYALLRLGVVFACEHWHIACALCGCEHISTEWLISYRTELWTRALQHAFMETLHKSLI